MNNTNATADQLDDPTIALLREAHQMGMDNPVIVSLPLRSPRAQEFFLDYKGFPMKPADADLSETSYDVIVTDNLARVSTLLRKHADTAGAHVASLVNNSGRGKSWGWYIRLDHANIVVAQFKPDCSVWMESIPYNQAP